MNPIKFEDANVIYGKNQPGYLPLYAKKDENGDVETCWELSEQDMEILKTTRKIYIHIKTFNEPLQPIMATVERL